MKFDPTKPVQTRSGRKARIIITNLRNRTYPIVAAIETGDYETIHSFSVEGNFTRGIESESDLINVPEECDFSGWLVLYEGATPSVHTTISAAWDAASVVHGAFAIKYVHFKYRAGEGFFP